MCTLYAVSEARGTLVIGREFAWHLHHLPRTSQRRSGSSRPSRTETPLGQTVLTHGPFPLMAGSAGYAELMGGQPLEPFFRTLWARDGVADDDEMRALLDNEPFIRGAHDLYGARVVRPRTWS